MSDVKVRHMGGDVYDVIFPKLIEHVARPPSMYFRFRGDPGLYVIVGTSDMIGRVDGGDPGDEQPAEIA